MIEQHHTQPTVPVFVKALLLAVVIILLLGECWCGYQVHELSEKRKEYKMDEAFVNNVSFGLLSVDVWRDQVVAAASGQIGDFKLSPEQENNLRKQIDQQLNALVDQAFQSVDKPQKSIGGKLKKLAIKSMVNPEEVHAEVPGFTKKLMTAITNPASYRRIKNIADTALAQMGRKIYDSSVAANRDVMDTIYRKYGADDKPGFEKNNAAMVSSVKKAAWKYTYDMISAAVLILLTWLFFNKKINLRSSLCIVSVLAAIVLLVIGVTTTIIEIDASLEKLDLHFLSKAISFKNQDLFFQSQSIFEVTRLLIQSGRVDSLIVGMMVLIFAVLFPLVKLVSIVLCAVSPNKLAKNKNIYYFAFEASKWDMSNVMVVAILMTFIGFNGIVDSTLESLNFTDKTITSVTTNNTTIQPGYIIFIAFVVIGFATSAILKRNTKPVIHE